MVNTTLQFFSVNSRKSSFDMQSFMIDRRKVENRKETEIQSEETGV